MISRTCTPGVERVAGGTNRALDLRLFDQQNGNNSKVVERVRREAGDDTPLVQLLRVLQ